MKHIVTLTISNPAHEHISLRRRQSTTNYMVEARDEAEAIFRASNHFKKLGNYVHNAVIAESTLNEEVKQIDEVGDTPAGRNRLNAVQARAHETMNKWSADRRSGYSSTPPEVRRATKTSVRASNRINRDPTTGKPFAYANLKKEEVEQIDEKAPPGAKYERMVKHIKNQYSKDGTLTPQEKAIAYATAWKAKNSGK